jgi:hypothetical protein
LENHCKTFDALRELQALERKSQKTQQLTEAKDITFAKAKADLIQEQEAASAAAPMPQRPFKRLAEDRTHEPSSAKLRDGPLVNTFESAARPVRTHEAEAQEQRNKPQQRRGGPRLER